MGSTSNLPRIEIQSINHNKQRYETVGDYYDWDGSMQFRVSKMGDWRYEFLVILHELVEWALVRHAGVTLESIDDFDKNFEADRLKGLHSDDEEPGDDKKAPYYKQHQFASKVEKMAARMLKVKWNEYDKTVMSL